MTRNAIPQIEIAWHAVKEHPGLTSNELTMHTPTIKHGSLSSVLSRMEKRGMVYVSGRKQGRNTYSTHLDTYELLEDPDNVFLPPKPVQAELIPAQVQILSGTAHPANFSVPGPKPKIDIDSLTIREAKELHEKLKELKELFA